MKASIEAIAPREKTWKQALPGARLRERPELMLVPLFAIVFFGGWEYGCRALQVSELILPAPSKIIAALIEGFRSGHFVDHLAATLQEVVFGFALAAIAAFVIGTLISQIRLLELIIYPYIVALQTLPKVALAPLILVWVGLGIEGRFSSRQRFRFSRCW